jgi:hypothetical protein
MEAWANGRFIHALSYTSTNTRFTPTLHYAKNRPLTLIPVPKLVWILFLKYPLIPAKYGEKKEPNTRTSLVHSKVHTSIILVLDISNGAQSVTAYCNIYCEKVKMCQFSSRNWFFRTKFVQLAEAGKRRSTVKHLPKRV